MKLESRVPSGPLAEKWDRHRFDMKLVNPANKRKYRVLVVGTGLAGAAAAALGAHVLMADLEPTALLLARLNTWPWRHRVRVRRLNWQSDTLPERFDIILGADILYDQSQWEYLHRFWQAHLSPTGSILLGEPGRQTGDRFPTFAASHHWLLTESQESPPNLPRPVRIFSLTRRQTRA